MFLLCVLFYRKPFFSYCPSASRLLTRTKKSLMEYLTLVLRLVELLPETSQR